MSNDDPFDNTNFIGGLDGARRESVSYPVSVADLRSVIELLSSCMEPTVVFRENSVEMALDVLRKLKHKAHSISLNFASKYKGDPTLLLYIENMAAIAERVSSGIAKEA